MKNFILVTHYLSALISCIKTQTQKKLGLDLDRRKNLDLDPDSEKIGSRSRLRKLNLDLDIEKFRYRSRLWKHFDLDQYWSVLFIELSLEHLLGTSEISV